MGNGSCIIPVTAALIVNDQGEVLIARRKSHLRNGGKWEFPGGKLRPGEAPEACLCREIEEEMGITIEVYAPFWAVNHAYPTQNILLLGYFCRITGENWRLTDHDEIRWVSRFRLLDYDLSDADVEIARRLRHLPALPSMKSTPS